MKTLFSRVMVAFWLYILSAVIGFIAGHGPGLFALMGAFIFDSFLRGFNIWQVKDETK